MSTQKPRITDSMRRKIAAYKKKHPDDPVSDVARYFNVTPRQVEWAMKRDSDGKLKTNKTSRTRQPVERISAALTHDTDTLLTEQHRYALAQLTADKNIPVHERVKLLADLTFIRKTLQQVMLQGHMRGVDAEILAAVVRMHVPGASDDDVIKIYMEAKASITT